MTKRMVLLDWNAMKYYHLRIFLLPVSALVTGFITPLLVIPTNVLMFLFFSVNTFAVEEKGDLNKLYLTLPIKRTSIVAGRYTLSICMGLAGMIIGIPLTLLADKFTLSHYYGSLGWFLPVLTISYFLFSIFNLCIFPILFKLGYNKGKFWGMILPTVLFAALYGIWMMISYWPGNAYLIFHALEYASKNMLLVNGGIISIATLLLMLSILLSRSIYSKREF